MEYTFTINISDGDIDDVTETLSSKYNYSETIIQDQERTIEAVLDENGDIVEEEKIEIYEEEITNPVSLLEHIGEKLNEEINGYVVTLRKNKIISEAEKTVDEETINPGINIVTN